MVPDPHGRAGNLPRSHTSGDTQKDFSSCLLLDCRFSLFFIGSGELLWGLSLLLLVYGVWLFSKDVCNALLFRSAKH